MTTWPLITITEMTPDTYNFTGDAVTFLGLVGVTSTLVILVTAFRRFYRSPLNIRVPVTKLAQDLDENLDIGSDVN